MFSPQATSIARGIKKKRGLLYGPMIQQQAARGIATQMVLANKEQQRYEQEKAQRAEELEWQREQAAQQSAQWQKDYEQKASQWESQQQARQEQWQKDYNLRMQQIDAQRQMGQQQLSQAKKRSGWEMALGGLSTAASIIGAFF